MLQGQTKEAEAQIKQEIERLHQVLNEEETTRINALYREENEKKMIMNERIENISRDISALAELIQSVKREMGAEDLTFLQVRLFFLYVYLILIKTYVTEHTYAFIHFDWTHQMGIPVIVCMNELHF